MRRRPYHILCLLLSACFFSSAFSQSVSVNLAASTNQILIGEPIRLQLEATVPDGVHPAWFETDSIPHFEIVGKEKIDTLAAEQGFRYRQAVTITSFDSGQWTIPPLALNIGDRSYLTDSVVVSVLYSNFDPKQPYHDIKSIMDLENPLLRYINWAVAALTLLSLAAVVYLLRKRLPVTRQPVTERKQMTVLSALDEALQALAAVRKQQLAGETSLKGYYTSMNDILKVFVARKGKVSMKEKTNGELLTELGGWGIPNDNLLALAQALRMSDVVKFAKFVPGDADNEQSYQTIKASVEVLNNLKEQ